MLFLELRLINKKYMQTTIFWFRRDLRLNDNHGLFEALKDNQEVLPIFIFDKEILDELPKRDARVTFLHNVVTNIRKKLAKDGKQIGVYYGNPLEIFEELLFKYDINAVYTNHDYEPYAKTRDKIIAEFLSKKDIQFKTFKDQVLLEKNEVLKDDGKPYTVYTPYSKKYKSILTENHLTEYIITDFYHNFKNGDILDIPSLKEMGFQENNLEIPPSKINSEIIENYHKTRDIPSERGTSRLSVHLRFGTISIRELARFSKSKNEKYFNELIWRDFYMMILWHFPKVVDSAFKPKYDQIKWRNDKEEFKKWREGKTGFPIVDAGMRELNETGYMHNRIRMVTASFLTKHLLIDWRWGEHYFAEKLLDFELSSNNGGWQWAAGSGCDAAPYFRVFNPELQTKKFDPELKYIKKWVSEFEDPFEYPKPMVDHKKARLRAIETYKEALN